MRPLLCDAMLPNAAQLRSIRLIECMPILSLTVTVHRLPVAGFVTSNLVPNRAELYAAVKESRCILAPDAVRCP